jgi:biotin transport system substrate-specific component
MSTPSMSVPRSISLREAVLPHTLLTSAVLLVAGVAFVAVCAQISIPLSFTPVPITGTTFAVAIVGTTYGANLGGLTLLAYYVAGMAGAPIYGESDSGWDAATGPTAGYLVGFILAAYLLGFLAQRRWDRRLASSISLMLCGSVVIYALGLSWLAYDLSLGLDGTLEAGLYPFIVGDVIKLYLAAALVPLAWRAVERFRGRSS